MATFDSAGVAIHYEVFGEGMPLVLVHGFASSLRQNWVATGWIETLQPMRQVIALDCRGHGESGKPYDPEAYGDAMGDDVIRLMDHLRIEKGDLFGYSMGGRISLGLMIRYPERFTSVVLGGVGGGMGPPERSRAATVEALLAEDPSKITDPVAKGFRVFAERNGCDLKALAALRQGSRPFDAAKLADVKVPVLIVVGENDALVGSGEPLAQRILGARLVTIAERDHLTVVPDERFKKAVVEFLSP